MDIDSPAAKLCIQGTQAEFKGHTDEASQLYRQAWQAAQDDYQACIAAHYMAHLAEDPNEIMRWNSEA